MGVDLPSTSRTRDVRIMHTCRLGVELLILDWSKHPQRAGLWSIDEQVFAAARAAYADHFVRTLPEGYETVLDDDAAILSQGERQLLPIARAFLVDPRVLILDEATSSVDTRTEVLIQKAMAKLMKDRTSFVIAHRLSTIRDADTIIVMDHGRIIEQGTHEGLIAQRGFYYDLYNSQFLDGVEEAV